MIGKTNVLSLPGARLTITVSIETGAVVTATKGDLSVSGISEDGVCILSVPEPGIWTVQGAKDGYTTTPQSVEVKVYYPTPIAFYIATITVTVESGATVTLHRDGAAIAEKISTGTAVFTVDRMGTYTVSATRDGQSSDTATIHAVAGTTAYAASLTFFAATITVTIDSGSTVTCTGNGETQTETSDDTGTAVFIVRAVGGYTITATLEDQETSDTVMISENGQNVTVELSYITFFYTGDYTETEIEVDGVAHKLYTLTSSGTLTLKEQAQVWACGGGGKGGQGYKTSDGIMSGGGAGGGYVLEEFTLPNGEYAAVIGAGGAATNAAGNATSIGGHSANGGGSTGGRLGGSGGSGGGAGVTRVSSSNTSVGISGGGDGISTYPFGIVNLKAHSGGGGGGSADSIWGRNGGTNGGDGGSGDQGGYSPYKGGKGGAYGGGNGGDGSYNQSLATAGSDATFYGGGGGGGGAYRDSTALAGGNGYQGVIYCLMAAA